MARLEVARQTLPHGETQRTRRVHGVDAEQIHAAQVLGLSNVQTVHTRAETYRPKERFDTIVSRAVGPIERFVNWSGHLCVGGGRLLAMKGRYPTEELAHVPNGWKLAQVHRLNIPGLDEERHLVELCRSHDRI